MIIHYGTDAVGGWKFEDPRGRMSRADAFAWAMSTARPAIQVLSQHELLTVDRVRVHLAPATPIERFERPVSPIDPVGDVLAMFAGEWHGRFPLSLYLEGHGLLHRATGSEVVRNPVTVRATEIGHYGTVAIETRCDAWLPFDLRGRPQRELSELNAPRLRAALEEIERALGIKGECGTSKFARCDGYALANHFDVCDEPIDIAEFGYDDSWFVAE